MARELTQLLRRRLWAYKALRTLASASYLFYFIGIIGMLLWPLKELQKRGESQDIDENALLPGQAVKYYTSQDAVHVETYQNKLLEFFTQPAVNENDTTTIINRKNIDSEAISHYLRSVFNSFGIDSETQKVWAKLNKRETAEYYNTYAIVRAPRSAGTESFIITAPIVCMNGEPNINAITYLLSFASFFQKFSHWSKDLIILFSDGGLLGTQAWLEAYHGKYSVSGGNLKSTPLQFHAGVIQEGLNLELAGTETYDQVSLQVTGLNGQNPNADIPMTLNAIIQNAGFIVHLNGQNFAYHRYASWQHFVWSWKNVLGFMKVQALGIATSHHALFPRYKIEGATVVGVKTPGMVRRIGADNICRFLESTVRCFGNLLERLHHSFWFYLMISMTVYIPIAFYIGPVILLSVSLLFKAVFLWVESSGEPLKKPDTPLRLKGTQFLIRPRDIHSFSLHQRSFTVPLVTLALCYGLCISVFSVDWEDVMYQFHIPAQPLPVYLYIAGFLTTTFTTQIVPAIISPFSPSHQTLTLLTCLTTLLWGLTLLSVAVLNPSLSVFAALPTVPVFLSITPHTETANTNTNTTRTWITKLVHIGLLQLVSPVGLLTAAFLLAGEMKTLEVVMKAMEGWRFLGGWGIVYVVVLYWPLNLAMQVVAVMG